MKTDLSISQLEFCYFRIDDLGTLQPGFEQFLFPDFPFVAFEFIFTRLVCLIVSRPRVSLRIHVEMYIFPYLLQKRVPNYHVTADVSHDTKMALSVAVCLISVLSIFASFCHVSCYPDNLTVPPLYRIDLDLSEEERWVQVAKDHKEIVPDVYNVFL